MKFSTREDYGLILAAFLAKEYHRGPVSLKAISEEEKLSFLYLEQLAAVLKKAGLIKSNRGRKGGYELTRPPSKIKVADIVSALGKPVRLVKCNYFSKNQACCRKVSGCVTKDLWSFLHEQLIDTLEKITLNDLIKSKL